VLNFDYLEAAVRAAAIVREGETEDRVKLKQTARIIASMYEEFSSRGGVPDDERLDWLAAGVSVRRRLTFVP
jgi:predicted nucleotidyltransferase